MSAQAPTAHRASVAPVGAAVHEYNPSSVPRNSRSQPPGLAPRTEHGRERPRRRPSASTTCRRLRLVQVRSPIVAAVVVRHHVHLVRRMGLVNERNPRTAGNLQLGAVVRPRRTSVGGVLESSVVGAHPKLIGTRLGRRDAQNRAVVSALVASMVNPPLVACSAWQHRWSSSQGSSLRPPAVGTVVREPVQPSRSLGSSDKAAFHKPRHRGVGEAGWMSVGPRWSCRRG